MLAMLQGSKNLAFASMMVRKVMMKAGLADDWSDLTGDLNTWMLVKLKASDFQVREEDDQRKSVVKTGYWRGAQISSGGSLRQ